MKKSIKKGWNTVLTVIFYSFLVVAVPIFAGDEYQITAILQSPEPRTDGNFGCSVAVQGDVIVVGEWRAEVSGLKMAGKAHVYDPDGNLLMTLQSPEPEVGANFGFQIIVNNEYIVVGEPNSNEGDLLATGKVHVFDREGTYLRTLQAPDPGVDHFFGHSLDVSGDKIAVGEYVADVVGRTSDAYVFNSEGDHLATLQAPKPEIHTEFCTLAIENDTIVVSASYQPVDDLNWAGKVLIFNVDGALMNTLQAPSPNEKGIFGHSLTMSEGTIVISEVGATVDGKSNAGKAHMYDSEGHHLKTIQSPEPEEGAKFGWSVSLSGSTLLVGEPAADGEKTNQGKVHVFDAEGNYLSTVEAAEPMGGGEFGNSVAVSGGLIVVGEQSAMVSNEFKAGRAHIIGGGTSLLPEAEEETSTTEPTVTESEDEPSGGGGIPGFPYETIILGLISGVVILWLLQRRR